MADPRRFRRSNRPPHGQDKPPKPPGRRGPPGGKKPPKAKLPPGHHPKSLYPSKKILSRQAHGLRPLNDED